MSGFVRYAPPDFAEANWEDIAPIYDDFASIKLSQTSADVWLGEWSMFESALSEARELASIAFALDTGNSDKEAAYLRFAGEIGPRAEEARTRLAGMLLEIGSDRPDLQMTLRRFRNIQERFRAANVPLQEELQRLDSRYQKITGAMTAEWEGHVLPLTRLTPFVLHPDRSVRERAYRRSFAPFIDARNELADIFDEQVALRQRIARNAGSANYRDYAFRERNRFDYTPADCESFHVAVERSVIPAIERRYAKRRAILGLDRLRAWDVDVDPNGRPALGPFSSVEELAESAESIFRRVDSKFGDYFQTMRRGKLIDLDSRAGKRAGGFCSSLEFRRRPFIFMNAAGIHRDVETLVHEGGHAFHAFESFASLPLSLHREPDIEMAELASMTMELFALPYLGIEEGGFYSQEEAVYAEIEQLDRVLTSLAWIATIDAFQHWVYTNPEGEDRDERDIAWCQIFARFAPWLDWSGIEELQKARWYRQLHIFLEPFYYIEYGIARLGALQVWRNARRDRPAAVAAYRRALALGGTRPLPDLFATAGATLAFDHDTISTLVELVEERLNELETGR